MEIALILMGCIVGVLAAKCFVYKAAIRLTAAWLAETGVGAPTDEFRERYTKTIKKRFNLPVDEEE